MKETGSSNPLVQGSSTGNDAAERGTVENTGSGGVDQRDEGVQQRSEGDAQQSIEQKTAGGDDQDERDEKTGGGENESEARNSKPGAVRENADAIPTAGGERLGEKHWGESKMVPDLPKKRDEESQGQPDSMQ